MSALPAPQAAKTQQLAALTAGRVRVTLAGGGFGESVIWATMRPPSSRLGSWYLYGYQTWGDQLCWWQLQTARTKMSTWSRTCPGKREQVWPSGPAPSQGTSRIMRIEYRDNWNVHNNNTITIRSPFKDMGIAPRWFWFALCCASCICICSSCMSYVVVLGCVNCVAGFVLRGMNACCVKLHLFCYVVLICNAMERS